MELRKWVEELVIYSPDDVSKDEAEESKASASGAWTVDIEKADSLADVNLALTKYVNVKRVTFCTHGSAGGIYFEGGSIYAAVVPKLVIPPNLFRSEGELLFLGCETARNKEGRRFLVDMGRKFFAGKGGIVGGATVTVLGYSFGSVLPNVTFHLDALPERGKLVLYRLDARGMVIGHAVVR